MEKVRNVLNFLKLILMFIDFIFNYSGGHSNLKITKGTNKTQCEYLC